MWGADHQLIYLQHSPTFEAQEISVKKMAEKLEEPEDCCEILSLYYMEVVPIKYQNYGHQHKIWLSPFLLACHYGQRNCQRSR